MSCIHYKFKCDKRFDSVVFDGCSVTLDELKRLVIKKKGLSKHVVDFDLIVTNAQTKEVYKYPSDLIQRNSSVIVARIPANGDRKPIDSAAVEDDKLTLVKLLEETKSLILQKKEPYQKETTNQFWMKKEQSTPASNNNETDVTALGQLQSKDPTAGSIGSRKVHIHGTVPHPSYICHRCNRTGHFKHMCPLLLDPSHANENDRSTTIKRATGIPRSELIPLRAPVPGAYLTSDGTYAIPRKDAEAILFASSDSQSDKADELGSDRHGSVTQDKVEMSQKSVSATYSLIIRNRRDSPDDSGTRMSAAVEVNPAPVVPPELICPMCKEIFVDAVMTPCCNENFCDSCIRGRLVESDESECPSCHQKNVRLDLIYVNKFLRKTVALHAKKPVSSIHDLFDTGEPDMDQVLTGAFSSNRDVAASKKEDEWLTMINDDLSNTDQASAIKVHSEMKQHPMAARNELSDAQEELSGSENLTSSPKSRSAALRSSNDSTLMVPKQEPMSVDPEANPETKEVREKKIASGTLDNPVQRSPDLTLGAQVSPIDAAHISVGSNELESACLLTNPTTGVNPAIFLKAQPVHLLSKEQFEFVKNWIIGCKSTEQATLMGGVDRTFYLPPPPNPFASIPSIVPLRSTTPVPPSMLPRDPVLMIDDRRTTSRSNGLSSIARRHDSGANASNFHRTSDMRRTTKSPVYRGRERNRHYPGRNSRERIRPEDKKHMAHSYRRRHRSTQNRNNEKRFSDGKKNDDPRTCHQKDSPSDEKHLNQVRSKINHTSRPMSGERLYPQQSRVNSISIRHPKPIGPIDQRRDSMCHRNISLKSLHKSDKGKGHDLNGHDRVVNAFPDSSSNHHHTDNDCGMEEQPKKIPRITLDTACKNSMMNLMGSSDDLSENYKKPSKRRKCDSMMQANVTDDALLNDMLTGRLQSSVHAVILKKQCCTDVKATSKECNRIDNKSEKKRKEHTHHKSAKKSDTSCKKLHRGDKKTRKLKKEERKSRSCSKSVSRRYDDQMKDNRDTRPLEVTAPERS